LNLQVILFLASIVFLSSKLVFADSVYIDMVRVDGEDAAGPLGAIWAVDSWFLTLVTLNFKLSDVPSGSYQVRLHEMPDCDKPGDVYNPYGDFPGQRIGDLLSEMVPKNGALTGIYGIKPPTLTAEAHKLTVIEMRGHALLLHSGGNDDVLACGVVREGEWEDPR
jgi:hypothetical protein